MPKKEIPGVDIAQILKKHTEVEATPPTRWKVQGCPGQGRHSGEVGTSLASIGLKHSPGYVILLRFDDGKTDTFNPQMLFPAQEQPDLQKTTAEA